MNMRFCFQIFYFSKVSNHIYNLIFYQTHYQFLCEHNFQFKFIKLSQPLMSSICFFHLTVINLIFKLNEIYPNEIFKQCYSYQNYSQKIDITILNDDIYTCQIMNIIQISGIKNCLNQGHQEYKLSHICILVGCNQTTRLCCLECIKYGVHNHEKQDKNHIINRDQLFSHITNQHDKIKKDLDQYQSYWINLFMRIIEECQVIEKSLNDYANQYQIQIHNIMKNFELGLSYIKDNNFESQDDVKINNILNIFNQLKFDSQSSKQLIEKPLEQIKQQLYQLEIIINQYQDNNTISHDTIIDLKNREYVIREIDQSNSNYYGSSISQNQKYLAYGGEGKILKVYDIELKKIIKEIQLGYEMNVCLFTQDSSQLYVGLDRGFACGYDVQKDFKRIYKQQIHSHHITNLITIQNQQLITCSTDKSIIKVDIKRKKQIFKLTSHTDKILAIDYKDEIIVSGSHDESIKLWNCRNLCMLINKEQSHYNVIRQIQLINNNKNILSLDYEGNLYKWKIDLIRKDLIKLQQFSDQNTINNFYQVNQDQNLLLICNTYVKILNQQGETIKTIQHGGQSDYSIYTRYDCRQLDNPKYIQIRTLCKIIIYIQRKQYWRQLKIENYILNTIQRQIFLQNQYKILIYLSGFLKFHSQKLMLDSRYDSNKQMKLHLFDKKFSIWFTYHKTSNAQNTTIFSIINENYLLLRIQVEIIKLTVIFNQDQIIQIQQLQGTSNQWFHLIVDQSQNDELIIQFTIPFIKEYSLKTNLTNSLNNLSIINVEFQMFLFCLIYDKVINQIEPIIKSTNMQQLIYPQRIDFVMYYQDSFLELFLKKYSIRYFECDIIHIYYQQQHLIRILEFDDILKIFVNDYEYFTKEEQLLSWFRIFIQFDPNNVQLEIQFIEEKRSISIKTVEGEHIFYTVSIKAQQSNYQFMRLTQQYKTSDKFDKSNLQSLNNCKIGNRYYFDYESNSCQDYMDSEQIKIIENDIKFDFNTVLTYIYELEQVGKAITSKLLANFQYDDNIPFLQFYEFEMDNFLKEPFLLWRYQQQIYCRENYFGNICEKFIKKCIDANNKLCQQCQEGYFLKYNRCHKCQLNCQICIFQKNNLICLLQQQKYYINQHYQIKKCECTNCNINGKCITQLQSSNEIEQFFLQVKCLKKNQQYNWQYFSLATKQCVMLSHNNLKKILYYMIYIDRQFYDIDQIQFVIVQNYQLFGDQMLSNTIISNYYSKVQLLSNKIQKSHELLFYYREYDIFNNYFLQLHLKCNQKQIHYHEDYICKDYVSKKKNQCDDLQCLYKLEIIDIKYYIGSQTYLEHNSHEYESIDDLLKSVKPIGIQFNQIYLEINLILQNNDSNNQNSIEDMDLKQISLANFENSIIEINLKISPYGYINLQILTLIISADQVTISNQTITFLLKLILKTNICWITNTTISNEGQFRINIAEGNILIFKQITNYGGLILFVNDINKVEIWNFQSFIGSLTQFSLKNIDYLSLSYSNIFINELVDPFITLTKINIIHLNLVVMEFQEITDFDLINLQQAKSLLLENISILGEIVSDSRLLRFNEVIQTNFFNLSCFIRQVIYTVIVTINSLVLSIDNLYQTTEIFSQSTLLLVWSSELSIEYLKMTSQIIKVCPLVQIYTNILILDKFIIQQIESDQETADHNYINGYLIKIQMRENSIIQHFEIDGIQLFNYGLLQIKVQSKLYINEFQITNIYCFNSIESKFITFKDYQSQPSIIIQGLSLKNILVEEQVYSLFSLFEVQNYATVEFQNINLSQIYGFNIMNQSQIFQFDCQKINLIMISIEGCRGIDLMNIQSNSFMLSNLYYANNKQKFIFKVLNGISRHIWIENSTFFLNNQTILFVNTTQVMVIVIRDVSIQISVMGTQFCIYGLGIVVKLENILLNSQDLKQTLFDFKQRVFELYYGKLKVNNFVAKNLNQQIFYCWCSNKIILQNIFLSQINAIDIFLINIINSQLIIFQLNIFSVENCRGIFFIIISKNKMLFQDIKIQNIVNVINIFHIQSQYEEQGILLRDISINGVTGGQLFGFYFFQKQSIQINNLFINADNLNNNGNLDKIILRDSINHIKHVAFEHSNLQLMNTEIIFKEQIKLSQINLDRSYMFDDSKSQIIKNIDFSVTLSFTKGKYLKSIKFDNQDNIQFLVSQNGSKQYYFYVPSGQRLIEYQKFNFQLQLFQQIYNGFYLVFQGFLFGFAQYQLQCKKIQYYNGLIINEIDLYSIQEGYNDFNELMFIINPHNNNYTVFQINCQSNISNQSIQLQYNVKAFPCQLGEFLYQNQCLECNVSQSQYSVTFNSTKCNFIDYYQIKSVKKGIILLQQKYWRYSYSSNIIENCNSNDCNGGWIPGDRSCIRSRIGALCKECDLYNIRGDGHFTNNNQICLLCLEFNFKFIIQLLFTFLWQWMIVLNGYHQNDKISQQYLMFRLGFRQYYQILYRQSIDQPSIYLKIYTNYIFMLYLMRSNLDEIGRILLININIINNPGLIFKAQLDCLLSSFYNIEIIYSQYLFQILQVFFILSVSYTIYFVIIQIKKLKFEFGTILHITDIILIYNLKLIIDISCNLLSYQVASGQKWIKQNMQYLFYSERHLVMIQYILPVTAIFFVSPIIFPYALKNISVFNRLTQRIYAVYHQEFKAQFTFWEYIIIYTKFALIIFQIIDDQLNRYGIILVLFIISLSQNLRPYYLQNLNRFELNCYTLFVIQLNLLSFSYYKDELIIVLNICIFVYFVSNYYKSYYILNLLKIIRWKQRINGNLKFFKKFSGVEKNQRVLRNKGLLINLIKTSILKKEKVTFTNQSELQTETEIELGIMLKQVQSTIYPSRQEPKNP
ncbi:hypothetical protein pb186bvf_014176 [Paramecium bursaria]